MACSLERADSRAAARRCLFSFFHWSLNTIIGRVSVADPDPNPLDHVFLGLLDPDLDPLVRDMDPNSDPDLPDLRVFGPPGSGSGSISQRYGSEFGSGSFYHLAKIVTLISTLFRLLLDFLLLKNDVKVPSKSTNMQKNFIFKFVFLLAS